MLAFSPWLVNTSFTSMDTPAPRLKLRLLICNPKSYGSKNITCKGAVTNGTTPRTKEDPYLPQVCSYECKSEAEWQRLTTGISKQISNQNSFHAYAHFVDPLLPPGPAGRVLCEAGGEYAPPATVEVAVAQTPAETGAFQIVTEPEGEAIEIVSTSQVGETVNASGFEPDITGSTPVPAAIQDPAPKEQPETAPVTVRFMPPSASEPAPLAYKEREARLEKELQKAITPPTEPTPEPIAEPEPETEPVEPEEKPLYAAAWDKLDAPMRLKDLAAALEVDAETLKTSLQDPESTVELGHAGWVKRREPKA
jgi:hypothetical protein